MSLRTTVRVLHPGPDGPAWVLAIWPRTARAAWLTAGTGTARFTVLTLRLKPSWTGTTSMGVSGVRTCMEAGTSRGPVCCSEPGRELESNSRPLPPKHQVSRGPCNDQKARKTTNMTWFTKSAKPPSPVQIRAAPPIPNSVHASTCGLRVFESVLSHKSIDGMT